MLKKNTVIFFCCFLVLNSCNKELKTSFSDTTFTAENNKLVQVIIPIATGDKNIVEKINATITDRVIIMLRLDPSESTNTKSIEESITIFNNEYNRFNTDFPESTQLWEAQIDGEIMYQSSELISLSLTSYLNTGGAHGNLTISFLNFDAKTGQLIKTSDLFKNMNDFKVLANQYFENTIEETDVIFDPETFTLPENIGFNEDGAVLLYNSYEIGPYSTGIIEFAIPFEKMDAYLNFDSTQ